MCAEVGPSPDNLISPRKTAPSGGRARLWPWCGVKCSWPRIWGAVGSPGPRSSLGERESSRRCLPLGPEGPLPATGVGLIFFAFCVTLHPPLSVAKETVTQPRVGPRAQSAWSLLRQWWFSEAALALEPEGGTRGTGGQGRLGRGRGSDPDGRGGGFAAGRLGDASQGASLPQGPRRPSLGRVASRYDADGSRDNREQSFPVLGVCGAWDSWSLRLWQVPGPCRPVRKEPQNGFLGANNVSVDKWG